MHTKDKLAAELTKAGLTEMAARASEGYYHDFLSPLDDPAITLAEHLAAAAIDTPAAQDLLRRHLAGEFDASFEESEAWANSPEGRSAAAELFRKRIH